MAKPATSSEILQELIMLRHELHAIRDRVHEDLTAMDAQIAALIPEQKNSNHKTHEEYNRELDEIFNIKYGK